MEITPERLRDLLGVLVQRVAGDKEAEHFFFVGEAIALFPVGHARQIVARCDRGRAPR